MPKICFYGIPLSPFARKVLLGLQFKGVDFEHKPVTPFEGNEDVAQHHPMGKIPLLNVDDTWLPDSSVMLAWLEREYPSPALLPADNLLAARALWFEEYADSRMIEVIGGHLFAEKILAEPVFQRPPNTAEIDQAINEEIPTIFDYISGELRSDYLMGDSLSLADIAVAGVFVTMRHCGVECDAERWPALAAYIQRCHDTPLFRQQIAAECEVLAMLTGSPGPLA